MQNLNRRIGRVDSLAARTSRTANLNPDIFWLELDVHFFGFRKNRDRRRRSMNPALCLCYRNPLNTMNAAFVSQPSKHRRAAYLEDDFLEAAQLGRAAF